MLFFLRISDVNESTAVLQQGLQEPRNATNACFITLSGVTDPNLHAHLGDRTPLHTFIKHENRTLFAISEKRIRNRPSAWYRLTVDAFPQEVKGTPYGLSTTSDISN